MDRCSVVHMEEAEPLNACPGALHSHSAYTHILGFEGGRGRTEGLGTYKFWFFFFSFCFLQGRLTILSTVCSHMNGKQKKEKSSKTTSCCLSSTHGMVKEAHWFACRE